MKGGIKIINHMNDGRVRRVKAFSFWGVIQDVARDIYLFLDFVNYRCYVNYIFKI